MSMTNRNTPSNKPFLLSPAGKDYLWGGNRLNEEYNQNIPLSPLAESWVCSTHPDGFSMVISGIHKGKSLPEVIQENPYYLGTHPGVFHDIPILIKLIDAKEDLSLQVHPDDDYAKTNENGQLGKTELWYILDATEEASIIYGFERDTDRNQVLDNLQHNTLMNHVQRIKVVKDDVFFIPAGTIHAGGAGTLFAEIQENSNLVYRVYDYDRVDKNGQARELHIDKALDVLNYHSSASPRQPMRLLKYEMGYASELLGRCKYFEVHRILLNTPLYENVVSFQSQSNSFVVLLCIDGSGKIEFENESITFQKGSCLFIPADSIEMHITGKAELLKVSC